MLLILAKDFPTFHSHVLHFSRGLETFGIYIYLKSQPSLHFTIRQP